MSIKVRLSERMKEVAHLIATEGTEAMRAAVKALEAGITESTDDLRVVDGNEIPRFDVTLGGLGAAVPAVKVEARELDKAFVAEMTRRGEDWAAEGAHLAVREFMIAPLKAALGETVEASPAPKPAKKNKGRGRK